MIKLIIALSSMICVIIGSILLTNNFTWKQYMAISLYSCGTASLFIIFGT